MSTAKLGNDLTFGNSIYNWPDLSLGDAGDPAGTVASGDRTVQVQGTFGVGGTVIIEGTLDMLNWFQLRDPSGSLLSFGAGGGLRAILENVEAVRPRVTAGDITTSIQVILSVRKNRNG